MKCALALAISVLLLAPVIKAKNVWPSFAAPSPRIVGGYEVKPYSHPYVVYLRIRSYTGELKTTCAGALIAPRWILSVAHCVPYDLDSVTAYMGVHDSKKAKLALTVVDVIRHPEWARDQWEHNDIALLRLGKNATFDEFVQPIRLPSLAQKEKDFYRAEVTMVGWGQTGHQAATSPTLQAVQSRVVSSWFCWFTYLTIRNYHICTDGTNRKGVCRGDSGGPLVLTENDGKPTVIGLTSFGNQKGCDLSSPSVFTRVTSYLKWISDMSGVPLRQT